MTGKGYFWLLLVQCPSTDFCHKEVFDVLGYQLVLSLFFFFPEEEVVEVISSTQIDTEFTCIKFKIKEVNLETEK